MRPQTPTHTRDGALERAGQHVLVVIDGQVSREVRLGRSQALVIGRASDADVVLVDPRASRHHVRIDADGAALVLTDLQSRNGTHLNRDKVARGASVPLRRGDVVAIGDALVVVHGEAPNNEVAPVLDAAALEARLALEVDRALATGRALGLVVVLGAEAAERLAVSLGAMLRPIDAVGVTRDGIVCALLPELDPADELARRLLASLPPDARVGLARCPDEGADAAVVMSAALDAARAATPGTLGRADAATVEHHVGELVLTLAEPVTIVLFELVRRLASSSLPVLVRGESGVGKEGVAACLHAWAAPARARKALVTLNCAALPEELVESELFGHEKGAFTGATHAREGLFEAANGGTVFLDEVGELSLRAQAKLLRAIETGTIRRLGATKDIKVSTRIVAATNRALEELVAAGTFREDLYFRLVGAVVHLPPLRDRPRDLVALTRRFLAEASAGPGHRPKRIGPEVWAVLLRHRWPGNVRELRHVIEYAATAATGEVVTMMDLPPRLREALAKTSATTSTASTRTGFRPLADEVRELEERRMREALAATDGNRSEAARLLAMPRRTFMTRMKTFRLE